MTELRVISRVMILDNNKILLVRNKDANFWYPPGGGWEYDGETLIECARREVQEETGYDVDIDNLVWVDEFREEHKNRVMLETFWRAHLSSRNTQTLEGLLNHIDLDVNGAVEEAAWFSFDELKDLQIFPRTLTTLSELKALEHDSYIANKN